MFRLFLCTLFFLISDTSFGQKAISQHLNFGPFEVGFSIDHVYDLSRSYFPKYDYYGSPTNKPNGRPMQIAMWYPTNDTEKLKMMTYGDYIRLSASEIDFGKNNKSDQDALLESFSQQLGGSINTKVEALLNENIEVYLNAERAIGKFPIVLYAPPLNTSTYDNSLLCEYLASHGYLVLSIAAKGEYSGIQENSIRSLITQSDDLGFLLGYARSKNSHLSVATIGFSRGGLSNLLFSNKNKDIDATVSLDGSVFSEGWLNEVSDSEYYSPQDHTSDLLMITKNLQAERRNPATFFNQVKSADKTLIRYDHESHAYFSSFRLLIDAISNSDSNTADIDAFFRFNAEVITYVGEFLDYSLKKKGLFSEHTEKSIPHSFTRIAKNVKPFDPANIEFWVIERGMDYVNTVVSDILSYKPDYLAEFDWRTLLQVSRRLSSKQKTEEARKVLIFADRVFPGWYQINYELGSLYEQLGQQEKARERYSIAINDNPRHAKTIERLKLLDAYIYDYKETRLTDTELKKYIGEYTIDENSFRKILVRNNRLFLYSNTWEDEIELWPYKEDIFLVESEGQFNLQILFQFDSEGNVISMRTRGLNSGRIGDPNFKVNQEE